MNYVVHALVVFVVLSPFIGGVIFGIFPLDKDAPRLANILLGALLSLLFSVVYGLVVGCVLEILKGTVS